MRRFSALDGRFDKKNDNIVTPKELYERLDAEFRFDHDPCPMNPEGLRSTDGFGNWGKSNFVNSPYSKKEPTLRISAKEKKPPPRIVHREGEQDAQIQIFNQERRLIRHIIRKMDTDMWTHLPSKK